MPFREACELSNMIIDGLMGPLQRYICDGNIGGSLGDNISGIIG